MARKQLPQEVKSLGKMFITGAILLVLAYPLTYTVQSMTILNGRGTRVHTAAVAGAAILIGAIMLFINPPDRVQPVLEDPDPPGHCCRSSLY